VNPDQALVTLRRMLAEAGVRLDAPDPDVVYREFKNFARQRVEGVDDVILYEIGIYGFGEQETYRMDLVRQFSFYEDGEYDRMEQLHCTIHYEPEPDLRSLGAFNLTTAGSTSWASGKPERVAEPFATLEAFFHVVDARPEWVTVQGKRPTRFELEHWQV
jgi:hypothetical protein